jgi:phospholipase C
MTAVYSGPIEHVVVVMFERRSYDEVFGLLYDEENLAPYVVAPAGQRELDGTSNGGLRPCALPITAYLANQFMVCDRWFASSASSSSAANHLFAHCSRTADDGARSEPNVFSALDTVCGTPSQRPANWKLYFHDYSIVGSALPYVSRCYDDSSNVNVANYDECDYPPGARNPLAHPTTTFLQDVAQATLPAYAFIEPRHGRLAAPVAVVPATPEVPVAPMLEPEPFDGERLLAEVYLALRASRYWQNTLLVVIYGEPGAAPDHVAAPPTWGGRVPAIVVSAYTNPGSRLRAGVPFEHASIVKTLWQCFGLAASGCDSINERDAAAPSILDYLTSSVVNVPSGKAEMLELDDAPALR